MSAKKSKLPSKTDRVDTDELPLEQADLAFNQTGRVVFDDRGNAVWEWALGSGAHGAEASADGLPNLEHPSLSLTEDVPAAPEPAYDPYDSGKPGTPKPSSRKKDLRRLSEWLKLKKQAEENKKI